MRRDFLSPCADEWRDGAGQAFRRLQHFERLTSVVKRNADDAGIRVVLSSGGAAGGVISEGQGYGLLIAGAVLGSLDPEDHRFAYALRIAHELFLGWKYMCEKTSVNKGNTCLQRSNLTQCGDHMSECFPSWKFDDDLQSEVGQGSATDGDEDALLGLVLVTLATENLGVRPGWWQAAAKWAYDSCRAFIVLQTTEHPFNRGSNGVPSRVLKLGSCWGGRNLIRGTQTVA